MAINALTFDEEAHKYFIDGKNVPSVTEITGIITNKGMMKLSPYMLDNAARRGTEIHEITQLIDYGVDVDEIEITPDIAGYIEAYLAFLRDYRPKWTMIEQPVTSYLLKYAGRLDRFGEIGGKRTVVDIKTVASADRLAKIAWSTQTQGYAAADDISKYGEVESRLIVQLKPNGKYVAHDCDKNDKKYGIDSLGLFLDCLRITKIIGGYK